MKHKASQQERRREYLQAVGRREMEVLAEGKKRVVLVDQETGKRIGTRVVRFFPAGGSR